MLTNHKMKRILRKIPQKVQVDPYVNLIEKRLSAQGEDYYCFREGFCFSYTKNVIETGLGLSKFEWGGNEIFISEQSVIAVAIEALRTLEQLKFQMTEDFSDAAFDIFVSLDIEDSDMQPSATVRFYKIRENYHIVELDELDTYSQPILICQVPELIVG